MKKEEAPSGKRARKHWYFCLMACFVLLLLSMNSVIAFFIGDTQRVHFSNYKSISNCVFSIDGFEYKGGLKEEIDMYGWAFCETTADNSDKAIQLILRSQDRCYLVHTQLEDRSDVAKEYKKSYDIRGNLHGYAADFSSVGVRSGVYDLYLYCRENEENYGLVHTGKQFVKKGTQLTMRDWIAVPLAAAPGTVTGQGTPNYLDMAAIENNTLVLKGWILAEGQDCSAQTVYIHLQGDGIDTYYSTQSVPRPDVAKGHGNPLYNMSGFNTAIAVDELPQGDLNVTLYTQINGQLWQGASYTLARDGNTVVINR
ncbi:MAG: hypothetical protein K0S22_454 [Oscillospiraceae bacterium]|jgi:hypothetical protein|nr:hypothetical protein [Oscillospiraceae bacterium]